MATDNFVQIVGNVTRDPELRFTPTGVAVCSFGIAWTPRKKTDNGWEDGESTFFNCSAWRDLGENIAASINKGNRVVVTGQVKSRDWEDRDGNKRTSIEIDVDECSPSLRWATATVDRNEREKGPSAAATAAAATANKPQEPQYADEEPF